MKKYLKKNSIHHFDGLTTPIGRIHIVVSDKALVRIHLPNETWKERYVRSPRHPLIRQVKQQIMEYFKGSRKKFGLPLAPTGTSFQLRTWAELKKIPFGKTRSYKEVAERIGSPRASRAVGSANGKNPLPIVVPCHRVIPSSGGIGGYSGGEHCKRILLEHERQFLRKKSA